MTAPRPSPRSALAARLRRFGRDARGSMTVWGLFLFMSCCAVGAAALDVTHFFAARTQLQAAADLAAHAALYNRARAGATAAVAKDRAVAAVAAGMPPAAYGRVLTPADITFGTWDQSSRTFRADPAATGAVRVVVGRDAASGNPVPSFLFRMVGMRQVDVAAEAIFATYRPDCLSEGFVARGRIDMQSNNTLGRGSCIHSNDRVEFNQNNTFEAGSIVSLPDTSRLRIPASGFRQNPGLREALRSGSFDLGILDRLDGVTTGVSTMGTRYTPSYITSAAVLDRPSGELGSNSFVAGRVHRVRCTGGAGLTLNGGTYRSFVLIAEDCEVRFDGQVILEDVVISTTSRSPRSFTSPGGNRNAVQIGRNDNCAPGGGAQLITAGGARFPSALRMFGGRIVAGGSVQFAARAEGRGASIIAGGEIDGTSGSALSHCGTGMDGNFVDEQLRLVR